MRLRFKQFFQENNPNHEPAGTPIGGRFARRPGVDLGEIKKIPDVVKRAQIMASVAHEKQPRKWTGEPYFVHVDEVAQLLKKMGMSSDVVAAAYLHDTLEDTDTTEKELRDLFGDRVTDLVLELTDISKPSDGNRAVRKAIDRNHLATASPEGQSIKLADLISNSKDIVKNDPNFARVYLKEKAALLEVLTKGDPRLMTMAHEELAKGFQRLYGGAHLDTSNLKKVSDPMGSNPGGVYEDETGKRYYIKQGRSRAHATNEKVAIALYNLVGAPTLPYRDVDRDHIASEMVHLDKDRADDLSRDEKKKAYADFATHAWLGNYDAVGTGGDNIGTVNGNPIWLDFGGALEYRAQGLPKGDRFTDEATEWNSLRDPKINHDGSKFFKNITAKDLIASAHQVTKLSDDEIRKTVLGAGGSPQLAERLIKRKVYIGRRAAQLETTGDTIVFNKGENPPVTQLNGIPFKSWKPPTNWAKVDGQNPNIKEDKFYTGHLRAASGVVIREPDGRVWVVRPTNAFGGYENTFPKGGVEEDLSPQANAIKEAYEETGLKVKITGWLGDADGDTSRTRYYMAERQSGDPADTGWESDGVALVPVSKLKNFLNRSRDLTLAKKL